MDAFKITSYSCAALGTAMILGAMMHGCQEAAVKMGELNVQKRIQLTRQQEVYKDFFVKHKSPEPEAMAVAVSHTKNPKLMAAIAVVESNANPKAIGDKGASKGAFQVQEKHWSRVKDDALTQALQSEKILHELMPDRGRHRWRTTLARYNGGSRPSKRAYRYADRVLKLSGEVMDVSS